MNELSGILLSILSTGATGTLIGAIWYRRHHKKMNALQEQLETANVEKARIQSKYEEWHIYKEQLESANEQIRVLNERNKELLNSNIERYNQSKEKDTRSISEREDIRRRYSDRINEMEKRFNRQTTYLRGVQKELNQAYEKINCITLEKGEMQRVIDHLKQWFCRRVWRDCKRRDPEQRIKPIRYIPLPSELCKYLEDPLTAEEPSECQGEEVCNG